MSDLILPKPVDDELAPSAASAPDGRVLTPHWSQKRAFRAAIGGGAFLVLLVVGVATCRGSDAHDRRVSPVTGSGPGGALQGGR